MRSIISAAVVSTLTALCAAGDPPGWVLGFNKITDDPALCYVAGVAGIGDVNGDGVPDLASGGFTEDLQNDALWILLMSPDGSVKDRWRITTGDRGFAGEIQLGDRFGASVDVIGDVDGDGVLDLAVGAPDTDGGLGAVWILFMTADFRIREHVQLRTMQNGMPSLSNEAFGESLAAVGDVDGDGVPDLFVGAPQRDDGEGRVWTVFLNPDGTVKNAVQTRSGSGVAANYGIAVASFGDHDGDGRPTVAVGHPGIGPDHSEPEVEMFSLLPDGRATGPGGRIASGVGGFMGEIDPEHRFGESLAVVGDIDGNGIPELLVGEWLDDEVEPRAGAAWLIFLKHDFSVLFHHKITEGQSGFDGDLSRGDSFGLNVTHARDIDGNGAPDVVVSGGSGLDRGALWVLFLAPRCPADFTTASDPTNYGVPDGFVTPDDFFFYLDLFAAGSGRADMTGSTDPNDPAFGVPDGVIDVRDFFFFLNRYVDGCE